MIELTVSDLEAITKVNCKGDIPRDICEAFNKYADDYDVNTRQRVSAFLAQMAVESGYFRRLKENLNYRADRLRQVWPSRFPNNGIAQRYAHNPEALANYVYSNRLGNDNETSGDGWKYIGRGLIQCTGCYNYTKMANETGVDLVNHPELLEDPDTGTKVAFIFWKSKSLNELADEDRITDITKIINGGTHGLSDRKRIWRKALRYFTKERFESPSLIDRIFG